RVHAPERDAHVGIAAIRCAQRREREERRGVEAAVLRHIDDREDAAPRDRGPPLPAAHRDPTRPTAIAAASAPARAAASASRDGTYATPNAAANASPAPVVSTTLAARAGT